MCKNSELKIEEYRSLMEEHRKNRSYIFEMQMDEMDDEMDDGA
jgi:hypothetical protein